MGIYRNGNANEMQGYDVFKIYVAVRAHFKTNYNYIVSKGRTKASVNAYNKRNDKYYFEKFGRTYKDNEVLPMFISIFLQDPDIWVGDLNNTNHIQVFNEWKSRLKTLRYTLDEDIKNIKRYMKMENLSIFDIIQNNNGLSILYKLYLTDKIFPETVLLFEDYFNLIDEDIADPVQLNTHKHLNKYKLFLRKVDWSDYHIFLKE